MLHGSGSGSGLLKPALCTLDTNERVELDATFGRADRGRVCSTFEFPGEPQLLMGPPLLCASGPTFEVRLGVWNPPVC